MSAATPLLSTRITLNAINKALIIVNEDFSIVFVNTYARKKFHLYKRRRYNGTPLLPLLKKLGYTLEDGSDISLSSEDFLQTKTVELQLLLSKNNGTIPKNITFTSTALNTSVVTGYVCDFTNVSFFREQLQQQQTFTKMIGHEAKQPLSIIKAYSYRIKKLLKNNPELLEKAATYLHSLDTQVDTISGMLSDLSDSLLMRNKQFLVQKNETNISTLFSQLTGDLKNLYQQRTIIVRSNIYDGYVIEVDQLRFSQVLRNLVSNAIKYSKPGTPIYVSGNAKKNTPFTVTVTNTGNTIPEEKMKTIFQPFSRIHSSQTHKGLGLGLAIVKEIVTKHGGKIHVKSKENKTSFIAEFPRY